MIAKMMGIFTLSLRVKVTVWSLVSMAWVVVLGGAGLYFTDHVANVSLSLVNKQAVPMAKVGNIKETAWEIFLRGILHAGVTDPTEMSKLATEMAMLQKRLLQQIERYQQTGDETQEWLVVFQKTWQSFQVVVQKSQELSQNYAKEDAMQHLVVEGNRVFAQLLHVVQQEEELHWQQMTILRKDAELTQTEASQWIATITLLFGGLVLAGWLYGRSVSLSLSRVTNALASTTTQMTATVTEQERVTAQQASSVNETHTTMEELGASSRQTSEQADVAANGSQSALEYARQGAVRVKETLRSMESAKEQVGAIAKQILLLSEQIGQIQDITNMVSDFANETKMLAMNAAVEAVRAGEHGKGFSVLAIETRKLADESKRSAGQISVLVGKIQQATNATVLVAEEGAGAWRRGIAITQNTAKTFQSLEEEIHLAAEGATQISLNVRQQSLAVRQVVVAIQAINTGAKESASGISQVKTGIQILHESVQTLRKML